MRPVKRLRFHCLSLAFFLLLPRVLFAFPNVEVLGSGSANPPFDFGVTNTLSGFIVMSDDQMALSYGESLKLVNLGSYALESSQPPALTIEAGTDGVLGGIVYDSDRARIIASQEDGDILLFNLNDITSQPSTFVVADNDRLGPIALDKASNVVYVADNTARAVQVVDINSQTVTGAASLMIPGIASFTITDVKFNDTTREAYVSTSVGRVFYIPSGSLAAGRIDVDATGTKNMIALAVFPSGDNVDVVDATTPAVYRISTSSHTVVGSTMDISENPSPTSIAITQVTNPSATYAYVGGSATPTGGVSIINTATDEVLDMGTNPDIAREALAVSATPAKIAASSSSDGYVYMGFTTGKMGVLTEKPFVTISSVTYSDGSSSLKEHGSVILTFTSDQSGTYEIKAGGSVDGSGSLLKDENGNTSGSITLNTDTSVTIKYDDNSSVFSEGANDVFVFVTSGSNMGRRMTQVSVDTPPPNVVIESVGFGTNRIYVNFQRLTVSDMSSYNVYVDTDPAKVLTNETATLAVAQAASGSTLVADVTGLENALVYYVAMEAVDAAGNKSHARTNTLADGSVAFGVPEETVGPAGLSGEKGCGLMPARNSSRVGAAIVMASLLCLVVSRRKKRFIIRTLFFLIVIFIAFPDVSSAGQSEPLETGVLEKEVAPVDLKPRESPQNWSVELKTGFWLPQSTVLDFFFTKCCNLITKVEGGLLIHRRYGIEGSVGFLYKSADAVGINSGTQSQDRFSFILVPMTTDFVWRADYFDWRYLIPYARTGVDYVYFREGDKGSTVQGVKFGLHGGGGLQVNVGEMTDVNRDLDADFGINEMFVTLEAKYQWINNFGGTGLNLSGGVYSIGMLFEF